MHVTGATRINCPPRARYKIEKPLVVDCLVSPHVITPSLFNLVLLVCILKIIAEVYTMPKGKFGLVLRWGYLWCHLLEPGVRFCTPAEESKCAYHSNWNIQKPIHTGAKAQ